MDKQPAKARTLPLQTFRRLPDYYDYLSGLCGGQVQYVSAPVIAKEMGLNEVQVRKDLAAASSCPGKPRKGFEVEQLLRDIGKCLGYHNKEDAVLVGAGRLGKALLDYKGFEERGVSIVAAFDADEKVVGENVGNKSILHISRMASICERMHIHIGIITVPAAQAQTACDLLIQSGILAIWNFAPVHLHVPEGVLVENANMSSQLALLSRHLEDKLGK